MMLHTLENRFKKTFARIGFIGLGIGFYFGFTELIGVSGVIVGVYLTDLFITWKENRGV